MTTQDYIAIAKVFAGRKQDDRSQFSQGREVMRIALAHDIADVLKADNARFSRAEFLEACEVGGVVR